MLPGCFLGFYLLKSQAGLELCDGAVLQNRTHVVAVQIRLQTFRPAANFYFVDLGYGA